MGLFDNFDGNLDDLKGNLSFLSRKVVDESKKIKKIAKVKYEILNEERKVNDLYAKVGKHFYNTYKGKSESVDLDEIFKEIDKVKTRISSLKMHLEIEDGEDNGIYVEKFNKVSNASDFSNTGLYFTDNKNDIESEDTSDTGLFIQNDEPTKSDENYKILTIEEDEDEFR